MSNRYPYSNNQPSTMRVVLWTVAMMIIIFKTFSSIARSLFNMFDGISDSRSHRA